MAMILIVFFVGTVFGSFINVLIDRSVSGQDWIRGRSKCDYCKRELAWFDLIPLVSFALYRGRSRCCKRILSLRYPLVEGLVGVLFIWWYLMGFVFFRLVSAPLAVIQPGFWLLTGIILLTLLLSDLFYQVVLMPVVWIGVGSTVIYRLILGYFGAYQFEDFGRAVVLSLACFGFFWILFKLTRGRGMADGDMYVALYLGLLLGWPKGVAAIFLSFILGAIVGVVLIMTKLRKRRDTLPFVPFMVVACIILLTMDDPYSFLRLTEVSKWWVGF